MTHFTVLPQTNLLSGIDGNPDFTKYNIFVDPETAFQSTNQISGTSLQFMSSLGLQPGLDASTSVT